MVTFKNLKFLKKNCPLNDYYYYIKKPGFLFSCSSVAQSCLTPWTCGLQHARLHCPSLSHGVCSDLCPLRQWCHPTISSSVTPYSSCPQSFLELGSFPMSWLFTSGGQNIGASAPASILPVNIQGWFPLGLTGLITLPSKGLSRVFSSTTVWKHHFFSTQPSLWSHSHIITTTGKTIALTIWTFVSKVMSLLFNMLSRFVIAFLSRSKHVLISWLKSPSAVVLEPKIIKSFTVSNFFPICLPWSDGTGCHNLSFLNVTFF